MYPLIVITGPTASGKTSKAVALARHIGAEIISADSRQIYRGMDLGTGKDLEEYGDVPYHLIDICPAGYRYNLYEFLQDYYKASDDIVKRRKPIIVCGGTGLYVESIVKGIQLPPVPQNPELRASLEGKSLAELTEILKRYKTLHNTTDVDTAKRAVRAIEICDYYHSNPSLKSMTEPHPVENVVVIGIDIDRDLRRRRITERLKARLDAGMVEEVKRLLESGVSAENLIYYGLEYKWLTLYVTGRISYEEMFTSLETAIHQFAKRQMTWFRGMERRGIKINWIPRNCPEEDFISRSMSLINSYHTP